MTTDRPAPAGVGAARFERYLGLIVAGFGVLYALQNLDALVADLPSLTGPAGTAVIVLSLAAVLAGLGPVVSARRARAACAVAVGLYLLAVAVFPFSIRTAVPATPMPWLCGLWPCITAYLIVATRRPALQIVLTCSVAAWLGVALNHAGGVPLGDVLADTVFMDAITVVLVMLVRALRRGVAGADGQQHTALQEFERSRFDEAAELERARTDALVHDAVLTTFLSASAARTPEGEDLAARMAANALRVLAHVNRSAALGPAVPFRIALAAACDELDGLLPGFDVRSGHEEDVVLPVDVAEAITGAMVQAMANSLQHAGPATRTLTVSELGPDGLRVVVADDGAGFDPARVEPDRLGLRVSVVERMRRVGGRADVESAPGRGTVVRLSWGSVVIAGTAPSQHAAPVAVPA